MAKLSPLVWKRIFTGLGGIVLFVLPAAFPQYPWLGDAVQKMAFLLFGISIPGPGQAIVSADQTLPYGVSPSTPGSAPEDGR